jgi:hypothetical protein
MNTTQTTAAEKHEKPHHEHLVSILIDARKIEIAAGHYQVSDLKIRLGVPPEYELEIIEHGQFQPLEDADHVHIHGDEEFVSHVRCGASS